MVGQAADEKKLVVWFTNSAKGLVLNRTNNRAIRGAHGDDVAGWAGKLIVLYPTQADFGGQMVGALRVLSCRRSKQSRRLLSLQHRKRPNLPQQQSRPRQCRRSRKQNINLDDGIPW